MRIGTFAQVQQLYNTQQATSTNKTQKKGFSDVVSLSGKAKEAQAAKALVDTAPDVRSELVDSIKSRIDAGTYNVSSDDFADKLMAKFSGEF